jgi:hypothetical protein
LWLLVMASFNYVVKTNLPPEQLSQFAAEVFAQWVEFALGQRALGNKRLVYPTGRYAASIAFRQEGESSIAIVASAPEAEIIEQGHGAVDLKTKLQMGKAYLMHRRTGATPGTRLRRIGAGPPSAKPRIWAELHQQTASGFASIGPNSAPDSWIIPAMPAYSPAMILAAQAQAAVNKIR